MSALIENLNSWGDAFLQLAWSLLWQSSLLAVVLFGLDYVLRRRIRPVVRYALWLVLLFKLLLPPTLALPTSVVWWFRQAPPPPPKPPARFVVTYGNMLPPALPVSGLVAPTFTSPPPPPAPVVSASGWALVASSVMSLALLGWMLVRWKSVSKIVCDSREADETLAAALADAKQMLGMVRRVELRLTDRPMSPAVCGLFRATILLPRRLAVQLPPEQLRAILLHELIHLKRGDVWVNCAQALIQMVYWWHPLLWFANARIRRLREEAVDDAVMHALRDGADAYPPTLLEVAKLAFGRPLASLGLVGIMESKSALRQRIERLVNFHAPYKTGLSVLSVIGIAAFAAVATPMGERPSTSQTSAAPNVAISTSSGPIPDAAAAQTNSVVTIPSLIISGSVVADANTGNLTASNGARITYLGKTLTADAVRLDRATGMLDAYGNVRVEEAGKVTTANSLHWDMKKLSASGGDADIEAQLQSRAAALPNPYTTNSIPTGRGRSALHAKLDRIRLKEVFYPRQSLADVVANLDAATRKADPSGRGIKFLLQQNDAKDTQTTDGSSLNIPLSDVIINISKPLADLRLFDVLDAIVKCANNHIRYSVEDYAVVFSLRGPEAEPLYIRTFTVEPKNFYATLEKVTGMKLTLPPTAPPARGIKTITNNMSRVSQAIQTYFNTLGVDMASAAAQAAGKSVFWNDRAGQLLVRATAKELDAVETALQRLSTAPAAQVDSPSAPEAKEAGSQHTPTASTESPPAKNKAESELFVRTYRVDANAFMRALEEASSTNSPTKNANELMRGFFTMLGVNLNPPHTVYYNDRVGEILVRAEKRDLEIIDAAISTMNRLPLQINIRAMFVEIDDSDGKALGLNDYLGNIAASNFIHPAISFPAGPGQPNLNLTNQIAKQMQFTGILTEPQFKAMRRTLDQRKGVKLIASPEVTTVSGRQAQVQVVNQMTVVTGINPLALTSPGLQSPTNSVYVTQLMPFGPTLDIISYVAVDGYTIQMSVSPSVTEFMGYQPSTNFVSVYQNGKAEKVGLPLPHFRMRQVTSSVNVWDGQTLVLGGMVTEEAGGTKNNSKERKRNLIVFITPTIIDQAGNRIQHDIDLPGGLQPVVKPAATNRGAR